MITQHSVHLRIFFDDGKKKLFTCTGRHEAGEGRFDDVYSYRHAMSIGWRFTDHIRYAPPGTTVAVCPECAEALQKAS
jgi:hypothetical protein